MTSRPRRPLREREPDRAQAEKIIETQLHVYALGYQDLTGRSADYMEICELDERKRKPCSVDDEFIPEVQAKVLEVADALRTSDLPPAPVWRKYVACDCRSMCTAGRAT